jgi:hypothetical protein
MLHTTALVCLALLVVSGSALAEREGKYVPFPEGEMQLEAIPLFPNSARPLNAEASTTCAIKWQGNPTGVFANWFVGNEEYAVFQDPAEIGCPNPYPLQVNEVHWIMQANVPVTFDAQAMIWEVDWSDPTCPKPGNVLCSGPVRTYDLTSAGVYQVNYFLELPPTPSGCCVLGPYFAGINVITHTGSFGIIDLVISDVSGTRPCANYNNWNNFWDDMEAQQSGDLILWSSGFNADSNGCSFEEPVDVERCMSAVFAHLSLDYSGVPCDLGEGSGVGTARIRYEPGPYIDGQTIQTEILQLDLTGVHPFPIGRVDINLGGPALGQIINVVTDGSGGFVSGEASFDAWLDFDFPDLSASLTGVVDLGNPFGSTPVPVSFLPPLGTYGTSDFNPPIPLSGSGGPDGLLCRLWILFNDEITCTGCCSGRTGNIDWSGNFPTEIDLSDLGLLVEFLFSPPGTVSLPCTDESDVDVGGGTNPVDLSDLGLIVDYVFQPAGPIYLPYCP